MATASKIHLSVDTARQAEYALPGITSDQASKVSELLQKNHDLHHIWCRKGHNHIVHYQLAIFALNASPTALQDNYDSRTSAQQQMPPVDEHVLPNLHQPDVFMKHLGVRDNYATWLAFFQTEIDKSSWQEVLQRYMFSGSQQAEAIFLRMFAGFLHPIIHLGYSVEFQQPAIVAEALAQAAVHEGWIGKYLFPAEKAAKEHSPHPSKSIVQLLDEIHADDKLSLAAHWDDDNKIRDGIIPRAGEEMIHYAAQVRVQPDELDRKTAEMTNAVCLYTAAAQHPPHMIMWDFYFIHCVNASIFFPAFNKLSFLAPEHKARLLEWKIRMDMAMYASRRSPLMHLSEIQSYRPDQPSGWDGIAARVCHFHSDGHAAKLVRALAHGQKICAPYEHRDEFRVKADDWLQMGHMAIDSVEKTSTVETLKEAWVRSAGFEEAWENIPLRAQL